MIGWARKYFSCLLYAVVWSSGKPLVLMSDLPTPSFVVDMRLLKRTSEGLDSSSGPTTLPSLYLSKHNHILFPSAISPHWFADKNQDALLVNVPPESQIIGQPAFGYLHASITRAKENALAGRDDPVFTFLAEIDLPPALCGEVNLVSTDATVPSLAKLVLGLNNHHVGSYYWARSAGAGASMDAPGVLYDASSDTERGILRWESVDGPTDCNSNDGKRSEWVNFLRVGDTVQLLPSSVQDALMAFVQNNFVDEEGVLRVYGVSSEGRPLGSEPEVVCQWSSER